MTTDVPAGLDLGALEDLATRLAVAAGRMIVDERPRLVEASATKSSPTDIVTIMDTRAEDLIRGLVLAERPDDAILGEEGDDQRGTSGITWVVDPIDGTVNYLYGLPWYAVSVAAVVDGVSVAGAVVEPVGGRVWSAAAGQGATCDGVPLRVTDETDLSLALVGCGFAYDATRRARQAAMIGRLLPRVRDLRRNGSAALELCGVAAGRADAFVEHGLGWWDWAAAALIAAEAGARVVAVSGRAREHAAELGGEITVVATPGVADALVAALRDAGAATV